MKEREVRRSCVRATAAVNERNGMAGYICATTQK